MIGNAGNAGFCVRQVAQVALLFGLVLSAPLRAQTMEGEAVATAASATPGVTAEQTQQEKPAPDPLPHSSPALLSVSAEMNVVPAVAAGAAEGVDPAAAPVVAPVATSGDADPQAEPESRPLAHTAELFARGLASWYGPRFHGRRTANGERYNMHEFTAAHKTLPFGTRLRVRSVQTGKEVVVRINDRGPYKHKRIIDLSLAAITALGLRERGVSAVELLRE